MTSKKTGFRQWSKSSRNIQLGCEHGCRYCSARYDATTRFHRCTAGQWLDPKIDQQKVDKGYHKKEDGVIAYPTTHDITLRNLGEYLCVLHKLLDAGNRVLITTKAHWQAVTVICESCIKQKSQVSFMFTIGSTNNKTLQFWEPNAPSFEERLGCLQYAYHKGYETSVSCEPYLDGWPLHVYEATMDYITGSFWLGKLNQFERRVNLEGVTADQIMQYVQPLRILTDDAHVLALVQTFKDRPKVRFKDSIEKVIEKHRG